MAAGADATTEMAENVKVANHAAIVNRKKRANPVRLKDKGAMTPRSRANQRNHANHAASVASRARTVRIKRLLHPSRI